MTVMMALLRGVNVGGRAKLPMADLRKVAERCGYDDVRTYIQSGNVVFASSSADTESVGEALARRLAEETSVTPDVIVRTRAQLAAIVAKNPWLAQGRDPDALHVLFMAGAEKASLGAIDPATYEPEGVIALGRELYLHLPDGVGRSKLAADLAKRKGAVGTMRSWRTVTTLLAMADEAG